MLVAGLMLGIGSVGQNLSSTRLLVSLWGKGALGGHIRKGRAGLCKHTEGTEGMREEGREMHG